MNILLIGSGGREHALAWAIAKSALVDKLYIAPGNAGMTDLGEMVSLDTSNNGAVVSFAKENNIDFVVVGPEAPLVAGLADALSAAGVKVFGPSQKAAQLEGSKGFTKALCDRHNIPTAAYGKFDNAADARAYVEAQGAPIVIKADGLAAGKGVTVAMTLAEALEAVEACFDGAFGGAGAEVVVEEFLEGEEVSFFALADGKNILPLTSAQDHKAVGEGDKGPNTGGMGAYSPAPVMTSELEADVIERIIKPTVDGMAAEGMPYKGVLFAGLMITNEGPKLIEYNCRFGDPECQVLMLRLKEDIVSLLEATADGLLDRVSARWRDETALTVVLASKGYPGSYKKGTIIADVDAAEATGAHVFHAGTALENGNLTAIGGRVLNVTAIGSNATEAQRKAYEAVDKINWPEGFCRRDIGWRAVAREQG